MSEKPEWFEMTDGEKKPEIDEVKTNRRFIKVALFTAPLLLVGGAMVFADGHDEEDRPNIDTTLSTSITGTTITSASNTQSNSDSNIKNATSAKPTPVNSKGAGVAEPNENRGPGDGDHPDFNGDGDHTPPAFPGGERPHRERGERGDRNGSAPTIPQSGTSTTKN
jgi:hypothetical protein